MWENYMDYSREDCQNSFTIGQVEIMRSVLMNERAGLVESSVSTEENSFLAQAIQLQPNPALDYTILSFNDAIDAADVRLFNSHGQVVQGWEQQAGTSMTISTATLAAGVYFVEVRTAAARAVKRLVVAQ